MKLTKFNHGLKVGSPELLELAIHYLNKLK